MSQYNFYILSSLRYDPLLLGSSENTECSGSPDPSPLYLFTYHRDRMRSAAVGFNWPASTIAVLDDLEHLRRICKEVALANVGGAAILKIRVLLSRDGRLTAEATPAPQAQSLHRFFPTSPPPHDSPPTPGWVVHVDTKATPISQFTSFKTTFRVDYDSARSRARIESYAATTEVLLWNTSGEVMDGSLTNVYFYRRGVWVTPPLSCGGQAGTVRRWMLEKGFALEMVVRKEEIVAGELVLLSNGVRGVLAARVV